MNAIGTEETTVIEMCAIVEFLLSIVSIETYVETYSEHLPHLFQKIVAVLASRAAALSAAEITRSLNLARLILSKVQPAWNAWDAQVGTVGMFTTRV